MPILKSYLVGKTYSLNHFLINKVEYYLYIHIFIIHFSSFVPFTYFPSGISFFS